MVARYRPGMAAPGAASAVTESSHDELWGGAAAAKGPRHCGWCGARLAQNGNVGRRRRYCTQSCRQRAYERRVAVQRSGLPEDAVILSEDEVAMLQDRLFQLRCAAEDVATAVVDGADRAELRGLAEALARAAADAERLRR